MFLEVILLLLNTSSPVEADVVEIFDGEELQKASQGSNKLENGWAES